jgi:hypothetical protein
MQMRVESCSTDQRRHLADSDAKAERTNSYLDHRVPFASALRRRVTTPVRWRSHAVCPEHAVRLSSQCWQYWSVPLRALAREFCGIRAFPRG